MHPGVAWYRPVLGPMQTPPEIPADLTDILRHARSIVVLTGAGVSAESGVPTFRDALDGLWAEYDPMELATPGAFEQNPELVTRWYGPSLEVAR